MTISRRYAYRGQGIVVTDRDGNEFQGTLLGWGSQKLRMQTTDGTWKEFSNGLFTVASA